MSGLTKAGTILAIGFLILLVSQGGAGVEKLTFSHSLHIEDAEMSCTDCHPLAQEGDALAGHRRASMQACADCHDVEDESACTMCHTGDDTSVRYDPPSIPGFSHASHSNDQFDCSLCHQGMAGSETLDRLPTPDTGACGECHTREGIKPQNHTFDWEHAHGPKAELTSQSCAICHVEHRDCFTCHEGDNLLTELSPHPLSYLHSHGPDARMESMRCESCHKDQLSCTECHASFEVKPLSHDKAGWLSGTHGAEARRDLGQCILCHEESEAPADCGGCHN